MRTMVLAVEKEMSMMRTLLLSVVLMAGCHQAASPAADTSAQNAAKKAKEKEMSDLLRKADAIAATNNAPAAAPDPVPSPQPVSSAALSGAPAVVHQAPPPKSKADTMRDQAATAFGDRLGALRRTAEAARLKKNRYSQICEGKVATQSECQLLTTDVADATRMIERELGDIEEAARTARIDPGVMHDLLAKYGF